MMPMWNLDSIIEDLKILVNNYYSKKYDKKYKILDSISMLYLMIYTVGLRNFSKPLDKKVIENAKKIILQDDDIDFEEISSNNFYQLDIEKSNENFLKSICEIEVENIDYDVFIDYDCENFIEIVKNFLNHFDLELYNIFCNQLNNETICIVKLDEWNSPYIGKFFTINEFKKSYIIIPYNKYLNYLSGIVHEFAHMLSSIYTEYEEIDDEAWDYAEIISLLMELIFKDYLLEKGLISHSDYYCNKMHIASCAKNRAIKILDSIILYQNINDETDITKICKILKNKKINFEREYVLDLLKYPSGQQQLYIDNFIVALGLFYEHKKINNGAETIKALARMKKVEDLSKMNINFDKVKMANTYIEYMDNLKKLRK